MSRTADELLRAVENDPPAPLYLIAGELVLAEPAAERLARKLAERAGCPLEVHRHPAGIVRILDDLRTFSLFASAKVVLAVDTAVLADRHAAADLVDSAADVLPVASPESLSQRERTAASRLLQALRLFGVDPAEGSTEAALAELPAWALTGGSAYRKSRNGRGRGKRQVADLAAGLAELLEAARAAELSGWSEGDLASLSGVIENGLPEGHTLVLAERSAAAEHPVVASLEVRGCAARVEGVESSRGGGWEGLAPLAAEIEEQTGNPIARDALAELGRRTLRKQKDWKESGAAADSTARFAAEYRKLAGLAGPGGRIDRALVERTVADRGEEDSFKILDAVGAGRGGEAVGRLQRLLASAESPMAARLSFFALLAGYCRRIVGVHGAMTLLGIRPGESHYPRFKAKLAPRLQGELPGGAPNPVARENPYALHRAYLAAGRLDRRTAARLPSWLLDAELELKGESGDPDTALAHLVARVAAAGGS